MKRQIIWYVLGSVVGLIFGILICYFSPDIQEFILISKIGIIGLAILMGVFFAYFISVLQSKGPDD